MRINKNNIKEFTVDGFLDDYYIFMIPNKLSYNDICNTIPIIPIYAYEPHNPDCKCFWFLVSKKDTKTHKDYLRNFLYRPHDMLVNIDVGLDSGPIGNRFTINDLKKSLRGKDPYNANMYLHRHTLQVDPWL